VYKPVRALSGGERARLALAILHHPENSQDFAYSGAVHEWNILEINHNLTHTFIQGRSDLSMK
jgi:hypothetical protein